MSEESKSDKPVIRDMKGEATAYLEKHNLIRLFEIIGGKIACEKPTKPNEFMIAELAKAQVANQRGQPVALFAEKDVEVMFGVFDITNRGYVNQTQYLKALNAVGIEARALKTPIGDRIDKKTFVAYVMAEVLRVGF